ncbi:MAG: ABC transporter permease [Bacteroidales bacterium]|nr:ABC transporter permease [Bacteroidales bacterium]
MHNSVKSTYRNFVRKPATNLINLLGLSVSLALVIILSVYSYSELTTDNYHKNGDRVYLFSKENNAIYSPAVLKDQIDLSVPDVEASVRMAAMWQAPVFQAGDREPITSDMVFADEDFFNLFSYNAVEGNLENALKDPMTVVLTENLAELLFGHEPALGKTLKLNNNHYLTISAVVEEPEANTILSFSSLANIETRKIVYPNGDEFKEWGWNNFQTFILLKKGCDPVETGKAISSLFPESIPIDQSGGKLIPLEKLYFTPFWIAGNKYLISGDRRKVMILVLVAVLVMIIALVNFINISSSQWFEKIKQTGVLKVIGAGKTAILRNILTEAFILFLMSLFLAILFVLLFFPFIGRFTGIHFNPFLLYKPSFLVVAIAGTFVLSLVFSIIPALRISSSKATDNLKKAIETGHSNPVARGILVTTQFVIAIVLIAFTALVQKQVDFSSSDLGFNQENIVGIKLTPQLNSSKEVLKELLQENPTVNQISFSQYFPGVDMSHWTTFQGGEGEKKQYDFDTFNADAAFLEITGLQLTQGRFFSDDLTTDNNKMVVNETFVREHELENPIGISLVMGMPADAGLSEVIGVVKDFHYKSFNQPIGSLIIQNKPTASWCLVNLRTSDFLTLHNTIEEIRSVVSGVSPDFPVEISFFDQAVENLYKSELQFRRTFTLFAGCAVVICCLGILAMSLFACQRRIKEIGVRKVNGAKVSEILTMLNKDFVKWVVIAFMIAIPIAYYSMHRWLENFAYKTELSWWIFTLAGLLVLGIASLTVSWQSWKAATRNPVEALRYE